MEPSPDTSTTSPTLSKIPHVVAEMPQLTPEELQRYSRHLILPGIGVAGQEKLKAARVALVGAGGLGSPTALYLAAAGVGTLGLIDFDTVDVTNLQRQIMHGTSGIGKSKLDSARGRLGDLNPHVQIESFETRLSSDNALDILSRFDIVVDGTDNFPSRYLVNDACVLLNKPNVYGSIFQFEGQASVFDAANGPCYRCLFSEPPPPGLVPSCAEAGVFGVLPGVIGSLQALETIKLITGTGTGLIGRLVIFDALHLTFREMELSKDPACPACGTNPTVTELIDYDVFCGVEEKEESMGPEITAADLDEERKANPDVVLVDVREPPEWAIGHIEGATLIPLRDLPGRLSEIDQAKPVVTICHHGIRSLHALDFLQSQGYENVRSLAGGMDAWSATVDPTIPRY